MNRMYKEFDYWRTKVFTVGFGIVGYSQIGEAKLNTTNNLTNSVQGRHVDGELAGIEYADQRHWKHKEVK